jgi:hypothetical protein
MIDHTPAQLAEMYGCNAAHQMLDGVLNSTSQAEAVRSVVDGLTEAFNQDGDPITEAVVGGFAVGIVNVLERGFQAIRAGGGQS